MTVTERLLDFMSKYIEYLKDQTKQIVNNPGGPITYSSFCSYVLEHSLEKDEDGKEVNLLQAGIAIGYWEGFRISLSFKSRQYGFLEYKNTILYPIESLLDLRIQAYEELYEILKKDREENYSKMKRLSNFMARVSNKVINRLKF